MPRILQIHIARRGRVGARVQRCGAVAPVSMDAERLQGSHGGSARGALLKVAAAKGRLPAARASCGEAIMGRAALRAPHS